MKIAILTQPLGHNYGGIMQAYALQQVLLSRGHEVITIDRRSDRKNLLVRAAYPFKPALYKFLGKRMARSLSSDQHRYVFSGMTSFVEKNILRSEPIRDNAELAAHFAAEKYDLTIVGSDQVWRPRYSPSFYNYFVDFLNEGEQAITYAASFGVDNWELDAKQTRKCADLVQRFSAVSVRESSAVTLCKEKFGIDAELVLDPTLLLPQAEYEKILPGRGRKRGVLRYILDPNTHKARITGQVASELGLEVFSAQPTKGLFESGEGALDDFRYPAVEEWLVSFRDAEFVVTDSFHGCVFAIIFNKPFIAIGNERRGLARFRSLLEGFGLIDRLLLEEDTCVEKIVRRAVAWAGVNESVRRSQEASTRFLLEWT